MSTAMIQPPSATQATLIPQTQLDQVIALDNTVKQSRREVMEAEQNGNTMLKAIVLAKATQAIRNQLTPMMGDIMQLVGSPLGFKTDKDRGRKTKDGWDNSKYSQDEVQDIVTVALLRGFQLVGNEINIIAGGFYATKEGLERQVREFPGLRDLKLMAGVPTSSPNGALVHYEATWKLNGEADEIRCEQRFQDGKVISDTRIAIRVNDGIGVDAIMGKAKSKMLRRIWERITGSQQSCVEDVEDPVDDTNVIEGTATPTGNETANEAESGSNAEAGNQQTIEPDLEEVYRQYVDELNNAETMDDSMAIRRKFFESNLYKWSDDQRSKSLRVLEKRQDIIRAECGKSSPTAGKAKSQKHLVGG